MGYEAHCPRHPPHPTHPTPPHTHHPLARSRHPSGEAQPHHPDAQSGPGHHHGSYSQAGGAGEPQGGRACAFAWRTLQRARSYLQGAWPHRTCAAALPARPALPHDALPSRPDGRSPVGLPSVRPAQDTDKQPAERFALPLTGNMEYGFFHKVMAVRQATGGTEGGAVGTACSRPGRAQREPRRPRRAGGGVCACVCGGLQPPIR